MVLDHLPMDPRDLRWLPGKHVDIILEEGDEREFLFNTKPPPPRDAGGLGGICVDLNKFHGDVLIVRGLYTGCQCQATLARA
jgi:hypothetical protein